jgi:hypothetical protein
MELLLNLSGIGVIKIQKRKVDDMFVLGGEVSNLLMMLKLEGREYHGDDGVG